MTRARRSIHPILFMALIASFFAGAVVVLTTSGPAHAQSAAPLTAAPVTAAPPQGLTAEEFSAQSRRVIRRVPRRVQVYRGSSYPGPNAVRICNAHYEQEYRPSGTVIVPRMRCYWSG